MSAQANPTATADVVSVTRRLVAASSQNPGEDERRVAAEVERLCREIGLPSPRTLPSSVPLPIVLTPQRSSNRAQNAAVSTGAAMRTTVDHSLLVVSS